MQNRTMNADLLILDEDKKSVASFLQMDGVQMLDGLQSVERIRECLYMTDDVKISVQDANTHLQNKRLK